MTVALLFSPPTFHSQIREQTFQIVNNRHIRKGKILGLPNGMSHIDCTYLAWYLWWSLILYFSFSYNISAILCPHGSE